MMDTVKILNPIQLKLFNHNLKCSLIWLHFIFQLLWHNNIRNKNKGGERMIYDKEAILENSNAIDVADAIGMDIKRCGSTLYTNCVSGEHNESHVAHNQLFSTGCFCYTCGKRYDLSLIHISEPTRRTPISYAVFCLKKKKRHLYTYTSPRDGLLSRMQTSYWKKKE